jgi:hypothetical protein
MVHLSQILHVVVLPYTDTNNIKTKNFHYWIRGRNAIENVEQRNRNNNDPSPIHLVDCPSMADVVFKAGTSNVAHPGNATFRDLLIAYYDEHLNEEKQDTATITAVIQDVKRRQGRFLEWNNCGCWILVEDEATIRKKVYSSIFYFKKSRHAKRNMQVNSSSTFLFERQDGNKRKREPDGGESHGCAEACFL